MTTFSVQVASDVLTVPFRVGEKAGGGEAGR
jgi:hypothetical protein